MNEIWHIISDVRRGSGNSVSAKAAAPENSQWFSGHFPENPILPGIAQIAMVTDLIGKTLEGGKKKYMLKALKRIKYKSLIKPGDILDLSLLPDEKENSYSFKISSNDNPVCSGTVLMQITE